MVRTNMRENWDWNPGQLPSPWPFHMLMFKTYFLWSADCVNYRRHSPHKCTPHSILTQIHEIGATLVLFSKEGCWHMQSHMINSWWWHLNTPLCTASQSTTVLLSRTCLPPAAITESSLWNMYQTGKFKSLLFSFQGFNKNIHPQKG